MVWSAVLGLRLGGPSRLTRSGPDCGIDFDLAGSDMGESRTPRVPPRHHRSYHRALVSVTS